MRLVPDRVRKLLMFISFACGRIMIIYTCVYSSDITCQATITDRMKIHLTHGKCSHILRIFKWHCKSAVEEVLCFFLKPFSSDFLIQHLSNNRQCHLFLCDILLQPFRGAGDVHVELDMARHTG